jgi:hypothetical protein
MQVDERGRQSLRERLEAVLGDQPADVLMELLAPPPGDWLELLRGDFSALNARLDQIDARFDQIDTRLDGIDTRLDGIDTRLDGIDARLDAADRRIEGGESRLTLQTAELTKTIVFTGITVAMSTWGLLFGAIAFG